jgi:LDH2 family malate/lactate/ureidoglycolate dehydrogenase
MQKEKQLNTLGENDQKIRMDSQDLAKLFNYPSIGELFSGQDSQRLDDFSSKLQTTRENLERIVRYGNRDEAARATRAVRGIEVTLDFLKTLQDLRQQENK